MRENGARQAVAVCVHGAGGGGWEWGIWGRVLAVAGFAVVAPDLVPAEGGLARTRFPDYRSQVADWCRGVDGPVVLIGASLGGLLALAVAHEIHPAALVLINPLPPAGVLARPLHAEYPLLVPWTSQRSLAATRRSMPDADDAACLHALRRWRDESGTVLNEARDGITIDVPRCASLVLASELDRDVPGAAMRALAIRLSADFRLIPGASHVGPLLGREAAGVAERTADWLCERILRRTDDLTPL